MRGIVLTVRFKLAFAFGTCAFLMLLLGSASGYGLLSAGSHARPIDRLVMTVQVVVTVGAGVAAIVFGLWFYRTVREALDRMVTQFGTVATTLDPASMFDLQNPSLDWVALAKGMGVEAVRVESRGGFEEAFASAMKQRGPNLIEAII